MYTELARGSPAYVSGLRGAFSAAETGVYTLRPAPYPWYDPETGTLRLATASAVRIHVTDAAEREWIVPGAAADFALTVLGRLAVSSPEWAAAASAAESGDWGSALALAKAAAGIPASDLAIPTVAGREGSGASAAIASLVLLSPPGSSPPTSAAVGRAEAYAAFLRLERAGFPPPGVAEMAEITASSFGNLSKASYVLPPFGWLAFGSACAAALAVLLAVLGVARARAADRASVGRGPGPGPGRGEQARRFRSRSSKAAIAVALVAGACLALAAASYYERSGPRFVSLGGTGRSVPSELAAATVPVEPGATGSILQAAGPWLFVELDAGGTTWLAASDAARY
jgi:hypothetical protein